MARFNEILVGRYNRAAQKLFSMKGGASVRTLADEVMPCLVFFHGVENRYLEGWERFASDFPLIAGGAGNSSVLRFRNPTSSNVLMVLEMVLAGNSVADSVTLQRFTDNLDVQTVVGLLNSNMADNRGRPTPTAVVSINDATHGAVSTGFTIGRFNTPAASSFNYIVTENQEIPVLPGVGVQMSSNTANQGGLLITLTWRERFLEDSERT